MERREMLAGGYRTLLESESDRDAFDESLRLARVVAGYIEDHNFFVEHWHHTVFWNKIREFGRVLETSGFLRESEHIFLLNRWEVAQALYELAATWASGAPTRGPRFWNRQVTVRTRILEALDAWDPPPALGRPPAEVTEPFTIMLWGITTERLGEWLGGGDVGHDRIVGVPASPGVAQGPARVIADPSGLSQVKSGEILVAPVTSPSWGRIFGLIKGAVTNIGGIMSHAAIVCREYGLPAVVGAAGATRRIKTGDIVRVDGDSGEVLILSSASAGTL
jgi:pyruvate,water dikinase